VAYADITREIEEGPAGPQVGALFDLDRTLVAGFSASAFFLDLVLAGRIGVAGAAQTLLTGLRFQLGQVGFSGLIGSTAGLLRGVSEAAFEELGERVFTERLAAEVYPEARALVQAHQRRGHTVAIVSSATRYQIEPLARDLGIAHVLCTKLEVQDGRFTGAVVRPPCYGEGKLTAARELARAQRVDLGESYFYTDSAEDLPLLDHVGRPRPTNPSWSLTGVATRRGWPVRQFRSRGTPRATDVVRSGLAVGSIVPAVLLGLPLAVLDGSLRRTVNLAATTWGELGTGLAGIDLRVEGAQHLWSHRPAVFIFNHQSAVDVLLLCKLLQRDFVGIAKQEARRNPIFGPVFALAGTVFIDRFNRERAIEALRPAVDALRRGLSIAIAPEGTRSATPRLGRFKKGAFHLALAARVPIVPIVFRNALDVLPKHGLVLRPATVDVTVHAPVPSTTWKAGDLDRVIEEVRQLYLETLASWGGGSG
jgi:putative phosphoserine phosphatase/1-acylglycerol-3-phosphate O-acyltransferase